MFFTGIYFDVPEITPNAVGIFRFNNNNDMVNIRFHLALVFMYLCFYHTLKQNPKLCHKTKIKMDQFICVPLTERICVVDWHIS